MDLQDAIQRAAELAKLVPESLQEAAFNRALDQLLGAGAAAPRAAQTGAAAKRTQQEMPQTVDFVDRIDRTKYPDIGATGRVADRALKVLQLAQDDYDVDGLTGAQIAEILTSKFRLAVSANTVNMALQRETGTVDTRLRGSTRTFHLMAPGEEYLRRLRAGQIAGQRRTGRAAPSQKRAAQIKKGEKVLSTPSATAPEEPSQKNQAGNTATSGKKATGRPGPRVALEQLLSAGYFDSPRTIADVREYLQHKRGHNYTLQDLSPTLVRLVRDQKLDRERNESGQYEYTRAK